MSTDMDWTEQALCAQIDPDAWFPENGVNTRQQKAICKRCKVRDACLQWALDNDERYGIYGGLTEVQRRKLARRKACRGCGALIAAGPRFYCDGCATPRHRSDRKAS